MLDLDRTYKFNDIVKVTDHYNVNTVNAQYSTKTDLNSIDFKNMYENTDNPSNSKYNFNYTNRVHETVTIINNMISAINKESTSKDTQFTVFSKRLAQLVKSELKKPLVKYF